ncbi:MAG: hypothetical protein N0C84_23265, partial [Candidatus Thiodiazotropha taylori]|nr:hypothetical protein [Candidatus Thiodiazotropha taylori]MCW4259389.1 hypothetical protein [Candidatus Thiodiazotropha taylori]
AHISGKQSALSPLQVDFPSLDNIPYYFSWSLFRSDLSLISWGTKKPNKTTTKNTTTTTGEYQCPR